MENKQRNKINLSIVFGIVIIIVIAIMYFFVYKLYANVENINSKIDFMNNQISELKNKNDISQENVDTDDNKTDLNKQTYVQENKESEYSIDEITQVLEKYLNLEGSFSGSPDGLLYELGYKLIDRTNVEDNYIKTDIKYNEFKDKMLNYMSEDLFNNRFTTYIDIENCYKNVNGYLYFINSGATGHGHKVKSVELKSNNSYVGKVYYIGVTGERSDETYDFNFTISSNNGKCIINTIDICEN